jgi:hypothetical protein
MSTES